MLALGVGIYGAMRFSDFTAERLVEYIEVKEEYLNTVAFILTFVLLVIAVNLIGRVVSKAVDAMNLGFIDRLGGFVFGVAKGVLLCSLFVVILNNLQVMGVVKEEAKQKSKLYPYVEQTVPYLYQGYDFVKDFVRDKLPEETTPDSTAPEETKNNPVIVCRDCFGNQLDVYYPFNASAPPTMSISSLVMTFWRALLYWIFSSCESCSALSEAMCMAVMRAPCSAVKVSSMME